MIMVARCFCFKDLDTKVELVFEYFVYVHVQKFADTWVCHLFVSWAHGPKIHFVCTFVL